MPHLRKKKEKIIFGGRLGEYKYYDMDKVIEAALNQWEKMQRQEKELQTEINQNGLHT